MSGCMAFYHDTPIEFCKKVMDMDWSMEWTDDDVRLMLAGLKMNPHKRRWVEDVISLNPTKNYHQVNNRSKVIRKLIKESKLNSVQKEIIKYLAMHQQH